MKLKRKQKIENLKNFSVFFLLFCYILEKCKLLRHQKIKSKVFFCLDWLFLLRLAILTLTRSDIFNSPNPTSCPLNIPGLKYTLLVLFFRLLLFTFTISTVYRMCVCVVYYYNKTQTKQYSVWGGLNVGRRIGSA